MPGSIDLLPLPVALADLFCEAFLSKLILFVSFFYIINVSFCRLCDHETATHTQKRQWAIAHRPKAAVGAAVKAGHTIFQEFFRSRSPCFPHFVPWSQSSR